MNRHTQTRMSLVTFMLLSFAALWLMDSKANRELDQAERYAAVQAEIATRTQVAHRDLELARVGMRVARGELTPEQGAELRDALRLEYAGDR